jgi:hypothetical protein
MTLRKLFTLGIILAMFLVVPAAYGAMALVWDDYTDPTADNLKIETSDSETGTWTQLGADLPTTSTAVAITTGVSDTRVYYRVTAFNTEASASSGVVNYYWNPDGGGGTGLQGPVGIGFVDCSITHLPTSAEFAICAGLNLQ